jgi:hypothetical protein
LDYATIKYDSAGQQQWVARYNGPASSEDEATAIAVDGSGNVYVTGFSLDANTYFDYATIKYNAAGQEQWVARYDGPASIFDEATAIAVDGSGNVYVTGSSTGSNGSWDYATIKYDSAGQQPQSDVIRVFALTYSRLIGFQRLPWLISFSLGRR